MSHTPSEKGHENHSRRTLPTPRSTHQGDISPRLHHQIQVLQHPHTRSSRIPEMHILEPNPTHNISGSPAFCRLGVDFRNRINEVDDFGGGSSGGRDIGDEGEDVACLEGGESCALRKEKAINNPTTVVDTKGNTHHEGDEEPESRNLLERYQPRPIPEHQRNNIEHHTLRQRIDDITIQSCPVRVLEWFLEGSTVDVATVGFTSERGDGTDGSSGFASNLSGFLVCFLVLLIFEDNDALEGMLMIGVWGKECILTRRM